MSIKKDFEILAKKLDNCELLTDDEFNVFNEDMMLLQDAFIGALATKDITEMERLLDNMKELAYRMKNTLKRMESIESPDVLASKFVAIHNIFEKILTMNK
ncbi:hypothetical protein [Blautia wexlerae]|uniref:hypothetical protein n=1 Tax=Blautia wexlerae TaxID=418240 RepID=UPI00156FC079|nr:hypothetical protein [Blautia wexlerae]NSD46642.1 hypothetical protein [Blautia wexlerae]NSD50534.1 hypothetical protein [Blautia wexlerae]NSK03191.1 hypothetical protein [Blautia wexlerae]NSK39963.1 hypothetical protein [Blautia wexlerae]